MITDGLAGFPAAAQRAAGEQVLGRGQQAKVGVVPAEFESGVGKRAGGALRGGRHGVSSYWQGASRPLENSMARQKLTEGAGAK